MVNTILYLQIKIIIDFLLKCISRYFVEELSSKLLRFFMETPIKNDSQKITNI